MTRDEYLTRTREFCKRGMELPQSKLTPLEVRAARDEHERAQFAIKHIHEHYSIAAIAARYGVSASTMDKALRYVTWSHVL